mgnify:CR=1 FL=1
MIRRIEQRILRAYQFVGDAVYYWQRGYRISVAIGMARDTIPYWHAASIEAKERK